MAEEELQTILRGHSEFANTLHASLAQMNVNSFLSPVSIHSVLALISQDTSFYNKETFNHALKVQDVNNIVENYKYILELLNSINDVTLLLANQVFLKKNCGLEEIFKTRLTNNFLYDINSIDFNQKEQAAKLINDWARDKTAQKTGGLVNTNSLNDEVRLALLNVAYFSGKWAKPFNAADTVPATFYLNNNQTTEVQMMRINSEFYYKNDVQRGLKILQLPYVNDDISLVIVLPHDKSGWGTFGGLQFHDLTTLADGLIRQEVDVSLPKFKIEETVELRSRLSQMGLQGVFVGDLFSVIDGEEINLNNVHQQVFIDVNELGSEFSSGTISDLNKADEKKGVLNNGVIIYEMTVKTDICNRFAKTNVVWRTKNIDKSAREAIFKVVLTDTAFITEFVMEIGGKSYKSYIKEKEEAKVIYNQAIARGQSAGLVEAKTRDSKEFSVSVNMEPDSVAVFYLTYEEMLQRVHDQYELVLNICPGQIVDNILVEVHITESRPLKFVKTPPLRSGNDIAQTETEKYLDPSSNINIINAKTASVKFSPDSKRQKMFAHYLGGKASDGMSGQFVVQYEVEREPIDGQVLLQDGYFVHFFAPNDLDPLPKHVVFALDTSSSMSGRKIVQVRDAMMSILDEIRRRDIINIIEFNSQVTVWDIDSGKQTVLPVFYGVEDFQDPFNKLDTFSLPESTYAYQPTIKKAKDVVEKLQASGSTYIIGALETALYLVKRVQDKLAGKVEKYQPIIVFLTDGEPNVGVSSTDAIVDLVTRVNLRHNKVPIFSLSFGVGADKNFLRKLSSKNQGFSRHIYEAADASLQLQEFYKEISSPLLADINFKYDSDVEEVTRTYFPIYFRGSELVVTGRCRETTFPTFVNCWSPRGHTIIHSTIERPVTSLERLWAYLTVKQLLDERDLVDDKTELTRRAVALALRYSFVTDVTSLVVVKPEQTSTLADNVIPIGEPGFNVLQAQAIPFGLPQHASFQQQHRSNIKFKSMQSLQPAAASGAVFGSASPQSASLFGQTARAHDSYGVVGFATRQSATIFQKSRLMAQPFTGLGSGSTGFSMNQASSGFGSGLTGFNIDPPSGGFTFGATGGFTMDISNQHVGSFGGMEIRREGQETSTIPDKKQTETFLADHPFLIFLQLKKENKVVILLKGHIYKPVY